MVKKHICFIMNKGTAIPKHIDYKYRDGKGICVLLWTKELEKRS